MSIREIANKINEKSVGYRIGGLQDIRKEIKGLSRKASSSIFTDQTISDEGWAFHYGGRTEIQFNIGIEDEGLRYGIAFSLEESRSLPDVSILFPKILKLNSLIRNDPSLFGDYKMWRWKGKRSDIKDVHEIYGGWVKSGAFIFIGKLMDIKDINYDEILSTFDDLLDIYEEIETEPDKLKKQKKHKFKFDNKSKNLPKESNYTSTEREINVDARHSYLQEKLYAHLVSVYGADFVGLENRIDGNRIDLVVKTAKDCYDFYEVKTGSSARSCIRQAMGQLFEYAFCNNSDFKANMIIAGEFEMDKTTSEYMNFVKNNFNIPISYFCIK